MHIMIKPIVNLGDYSIGSRSAFRYRTCDFKRSSSQWTLARVNFPSEQRANVKVTCTTTVSQYNSLVYMYMYCSRELVYGGCLIWTKINN